MTLITITPDLLKEHPKLVGMTTTQYQQIVEAGIFPSGTPIELIDGLIIPKNRAAAGEDLMSIGKRHVNAVNKLMRVNAQLPAGFILQVQQPVELPPDSEPEPDGSLLRGGEDDYLDRLAQPRDAIAVFEVADSSLQQDRTSKLRVYADAGIPQYVIVNLVDNVIESYTDPRVGNGRYEKVERLTASDTLVILLSPDQPFSISAASLLPPNSK